MGSGPSELWKAPGKEKEPKTTISEHNTATLLIGGLIKQKRPENPPGRVHTNACQAPPALSSRRKPSARLSETRSRAKALTFGILRLWLAPGRLRRQFGPYPAGGLLQLPGGKAFFRERG